MARRSATPPAYPAESRRHRLVRTHLGAPQSSLRGGEADEAIHAGVGHGLFRCARMTGLEWRGCGPHPSTAVRLRGRAGGRPPAGRPGRDGGPSSAGDRLPPRRPRRKPRPAPRAPPHRRRHRPRPGQQSRVGRAAEAAAMRRTISSTRQGVELDIGRLGLGQALPQLRLQARIGGRPDRRDPRRGDLRSAVTGCPAATAPADRERKTRPAAR